MRRTRTRPSWTELHRIEAALRCYPAFAGRLRPKTQLARKRNGQAVRFSLFVVRVAVAMRAVGLDPERAPVLRVVAVAAQVAAQMDASSGEAAPGNRDQNDVDELG